MTPRTRILHVVGNLEFGGGQKLTALLAVSLDPARFEVAVLNFGGEGPYNQLLGAKGIEVINLGLFRPILRNSPRRLWIAARRLAATLFRRPRWAIVHTHMFMTAVVCTVPARLRGCRVLGTSHRIYYPRIQPLVERLLAFLQDAIVVDSAAVGEILREHTRIPRSKYVVIHNGIDLEEFSDAPGTDAARAALGLPAGSVVVAEIAHLVKHKGQMQLLKAWKKVHSKHPGALLVLVGEGPLRQSIEAEISALGVEGSVRLLGARGDLATVLSAIDVLALPSTFEGFGTVQAEAMLLEKPVVGTAYGGALEVVEHAVTGYLVPFGDIDALAGRLNELVGSSDLRARFGRAGRERVLERFTARKMGEQYAALYRDLLR